MMHTRMPGQCGAHVLYYGWEQPYTMEQIAQSIKRSNDNFDGACVMFSGNNRDNEPADFATWLINQGEKVKSSNWIPNPRHGTNIRMFRWEPSGKFRDKVQKLINKLRKEDQTNGVPHF